MSRSDAPGRVVTRLERLMGSDKVSLLDHEWMRELEEQLEGEDKKEWLRRNKNRMKVEHMRFRKLAIDGLMPIPPTMEMQDIYNHPIYRVNKIMKRLNKFDYSAMLNPKTVMPPLTLIDPFKDDESGQSFKSFPGHINLEETASLMSVARSKSFARIKKPAKPVSKLTTTPVVSTQTSVLSFASTAGEDGETDQDLDRPSQHSTVPDKASSTLLVQNEGDEEEEEGEGDEVEKIMREVSAVETAYTESLSNLQKKYSIDEGSNLAIWQPFQSQLLDVFDTMNIDTENAVVELYKMAEEVVGVYNREVVQAEETIITLNKVVNAVVNNMGVPTPIKSASSVSSMHDTVPRNSSRISTTGSV
ncbi:uncharacterized protein LOC118435345 [Folsomia candida]|uniref:uncharacterized protein LOC118435345 n=1 Tax=Folsomia candida TaxID=158441 RepID=UPI001604A611|nr:uncharacterized protein LOC118435345 [Folsomia candida]